MQATAEEDVFPVQTWVTGHVALKKRKRKKVIKTGDILTVIVFKLCAFLTFCKSEKRSTLSADLS